MKRILIVSGLALAALWGCSADQSAEGPAAASAPAAGEVSEAASGTDAAAAAPEALSPAGTGENPASRAFIDPVTGEMRAPTAAELAASKATGSTEQAGRQERPPPVETKLPDGTIMYDMRNQPQVQEKVCVQSDGSLGACPAK